MQTIFFLNTRNNYRLIKFLLSYYSLLQSVFTKLNNCQKHIKTHFNQDSVDEESDKKEIKKTGEVYKCNMCSCTYLHAATLSKHIVSKHIKMKAN